MAVLPILVPPVLPYAVGGTPLDTQPSIMTAPSATSGILPMGSYFVLLFANPVGNTTTLLASSSIPVLMRFGLPDGSSASGQVQVTSSTSGLVTPPFALRAFGGTIPLTPVGPGSAVFQVQCTLAQTIAINTWVVQTQFL